MEFDRQKRYASTGAAAAQDAPVPGKQTLTQGMVHPAAAARSAPSEPAPAPPLSVPSGPRPTLQMLFGRRSPTSDPEQVHAAAARGTSTAAGQLPHFEQIQRSFGRHDISGVQAHVGADAAASAQEMGAAAYATGNHVVLGAGTDLHTVAHEAAHVVQQRGGVQLKGSVGQVGDAYEQHADAVADLVVQGRSAEALLDQHSGGSGTGAASGAPAVQHKLPTDGLAGPSLAKRIATYNQALDTLLEGKDEITDSHISKLKVALLEIKTHFMNFQTGLDDYGKRRLLKLVDAEVTDLKAAGKNRSSLKEKLGAIRGEQSLESKESKKESQVIIRDRDTGTGLKPERAQNNKLGKREPHSSSLDNRSLDNSKPDNSKPDYSKLDNSKLENNKDTLGGRERLRNAKVTRKENHTRIGFEIELARHYRVPSQFEPSVAPFINQTLLKYPLDLGSLEMQPEDERPALEMLLDDLKPSRTPGHIDLQVEFRTSALELQLIRQDLRQIIRGAITKLDPQTIFTGTTGEWTKTKEFHELTSKVGGNQFIVEGSGKFEPPPSLAQHVTSSINLEAYTKLSAKDQELLYKHGVNCRKKIQLYTKILDTINRNQSQIPGKKQRMRREWSVDSSTSGRDTLQHCVKSSIEAMLAAERVFEITGHQALVEAMSKQNLPTSVFVSRTDDYKDKHDIDGNLERSVSGVERRGRYPSIQGEQVDDKDRGYLAVAEKLQPPLYDPSNQELRVLIEHRGDELVKALNDVLDGKTSEVWHSFCEAVGKMDKQASSNNNNNNNN